MNLSNSDLNKVRTIVKEEVEDVLEEKLEEKLTKLKSEFFERIDPILIEVVTAREERPLIENRLEKLEKHIQAETHSLSSQ
jgi:BMFP domain-containing protein YqiC